MEVHEPCKNHRNNVAACRGTPETKQRSKSCRLWLEGTRVSSDVCGFQGLRREV